MHDSAGLQKGKSIYIHPSYKKSFICASGKRFTDARLKFRRNLKLRYRPQTFIVWLHNKFKYSLQIDHQR